MRLTAVLASICLATIASALPVAAGAPDTLAVRAVRDVAVVMEREVVDLEARKYPRRRPKHNEGEPWKKPTVKREDDSADLEARSMPRAKGRGNGRGNGKGKAKAKAKAKGAKAKAAPKKKMTVPKVARAQD
ncbi:hypothetical protein RQP46_007376 [Phenoliferia psychrophenolica]